MPFLLGAIALSVLLAWLVVWWHRRPKSMERGIDEFWEARQAIAPLPPEARPQVPPEGGHDPGTDDDAGDSGHRR